MSYILDLFVTTPTPTPGGKLITGGGTPKLFRLPDALAPLRRVRVERLFVD